MSRNNFEKIRQGSELLLLALVMLCSSSLNANAQQSTRLNLEVRIVQTSKEQIKAEIGRFIVPENYRRPSGKQITLAFIRFGATTRNPGPPMLYLAGGPGTSGIEYATGRRFESYLGLRQFGDIIALDQRGTGLSPPSLNCPRKFFYPLDRAATRQSLARAYRSFARPCSQYWKRKGVDLAAYNTEASADDVKALSDIMGVKQFRLFAASYGTHLGLSIIRRHPDLVERAVFGGIEGPDQTIKLPLDVETHLAKVSNMIAADP